LACNHDPVIFTLPDELRGLGLANGRVLTDVLFSTVRETLCELLGDERYLGAQPGLVAALHTWSQTLVLHPHVHGLVTGGGLTADGQWHTVRHGFLLPLRVVMAVFRGTLLAAIETAWRRGQLTLPAGMTRRPWETFRHKLGRRKGNGHVRERYPHGNGVLTSLARSIRGGPLAHTRLVACENGTVAFRYRVNGEATGSTRRALMTWPSAECIRRALVHGPEPGTKVVRGYGLYAPTKGEALAVGRAHVGQGPVVQPPALDWQTACQDRGDAHPERCPRCGRRLVAIGVIPRSGRPPPVEAPSEVAA
jgi:hypothetical protein